MCKSYKFPGLLPRTVLLKVNLLTRPVSLFNEQVLDSFLCVVLGYVIIVSTLCKAMITWVVQNNLNQSTVIYLLY